MKDDLISRQAAIKTAHLPVIDDAGYEVVRVDDILALPSVQLAQDLTKGCTDAVSRQGVLRLLNAIPSEEFATKAMLIGGVNALPSAQTDADKYEYHYDHTDCIWYRPEARNRCPVTCAQYRDGWNDAMNYIFRDGQGYRPYRRDERYER